MIDNVTIFVNIICWNHLSHFLVLIESTCVLVSISHVVHKYVMNLLQYIFSFLCKINSDWETVTIENNMATWFRGTNYFDNLWDLAWLIFIVILIPNKDHQRVKGCNSDAGGIRKSSIYCEPFIISFVFHEGESIRGDLQDSSLECNSRVFNW